MKIGDNVIVSDRNPNHLGYGVCAYAGMSGIVTDVGEDGSFIVQCATSILIVPMVIYGRPKIYWVWVNGELIRHKGIVNKTESIVDFKLNIIDRIKKYFFNLPWI